MQREVSITFEGSVEEEQSRLPFATPFLEDADR